MFVALALLAIGAFAVAQDRRPPAAGEDAAAAEEPEKKWEEHTGDLPFVFGFYKGMEQVKLTGHPPMYFFTAT
jgi:hypothetical protein